MLKMEATRGGDRFMFTQEQLKKIEKNCQEIQKGFESIWPNINDFVKEFEQANREALKQKKRVRERLRCGARKTSTDIV